MHLPPSQPVVLELFVCYCTPALLVRSRSLVLLHAKDAPLDQVEEVILVLGLASTA